MAWALWLLAPVGATVLAAIASWLRSRPRRPPTTDEAVRAHSEFLDALAKRAATLPGCDSPSRPSSGSQAGGPSQR
jgi:hypothetical protein